MQGHAVLVDSVLKVNASPIQSGRVFSLTLPRGALSLHQLAEACASLMTALEGDEGVVFDGNSVDLLVSCNTNRIDQATTPSATASSPPTTRQVRPHLHPRRRRHHLHFDLSP
jgi:hypothetical protein